MEKFTNNHSEYWESIERGLLTFERSDKWRNLFVYLEMAQSLDYAFAVCCEVENGNKDVRLRLKKLNKGLPNANRISSIYNLDRISFVEEFLDPVDWKKLGDAKDIFVGFGCVKNEGIVLGGLRCSFASFPLAAKLNWNIDAEMNKALSSFIKKIRIQAYAQLD